jgi:hypothetical protein
MSEIIHFIKEHIQKIIIIVVVVVLFLLVLINIKDIDLNAPKPESKLVQQVVVETFDQQQEDEDIIKIMGSPSENFCKSYLGNSVDLEKACNSLTESNCGKVKCCVYSKTNSKCVAGNINGPTYKTDKDGKLITMDSYYYLGKCRGRCPT